MSSSVFANNRGADHRANSGASYAADRWRQAPRRAEIRIRFRPLINSTKLPRPRANLSLVASKRARKSHFWRFLTFFSVLFIVFGVTSASPARAQKPQGRSQAEKASSAVDLGLAAKLTGNFRSAIADKPLRDALVSIAEAAQINLWLDRRVDPTVPSSSDPVATTVYQTLASVAKSAELTILPVQNVVLVGRAQWVEKTAAVLRSLETKGQQGNFAWPDLTTPTQAIEIVVGNAATTQPALPHDLWPRQSFAQLPPQVAAALITSQFDLMPSDDALKTMTPLTAPPRSSALYPTGKHAAALRAEVTKVDRTSSLREVNSQLMLTGSPAAHRAATDAWLRTTGAETSKPIDLDKLRFSLRLENAVAEQVLTQLAATSGRKLVIDPQVAEACKKPVTLAIEDETMRTLTDKISVSVGVQIRWTDTQLQVSELP